MLEFHWSISLPARSGWFTRTWCPSGDENSFPRRPPPPAINAKSLFCIHFNLNELRLLSQIQSTSAKQTFMDSLESVHRIRNNNCAEQSIEHEVTTLNLLWPKSVGHPIMSKFIGHPLTFL